MKKIYAILWWIVWQAMMIACLWYGYAYHTPFAGARRVAAFLIILSTIIAIFGYKNMAMIKKQAAIKGYPYIPPTIDGIYDLAIALFLVWFGRFFLASIWIIQLVFCQGHYDLVKQYRKDHQI
jgi:hypothetical protein